MQTLIPLCYDLFPVGCVFQEDPRKKRSRSQSIIASVPGGSRELNRTSSNDDLTKNLGPLPVRYHHFYTKL